MATVVRKDKFRQGVFTDFVMAADVGKAGIYVWRNGAFPLEMHALLRGC